jgi:hypothetical protein
MGTPITVDANLMKIETYGSCGTYLERRFFDKIYNEAYVLVTQSTSNNDDKQRAIRILRYLIHRRIVHEEAKRLLSAILATDEALVTYCNNLTLQPDGNFI